MNVQESLNAIQTILVTKVGIPRSCSNYHNFNASQNSVSIMIQFKFIGITLELPGKVTLRRVKWKIAMLCPRNLGVVYAKYIPNGSN